MIQKYTTKDKIFSKIVDFIITDMGMPNFPDLPIMADKLTADILNIVESNLKGRTEDYEKNN